MFSNGRYTIVRTGRMGYEGRGGQRRSDLMTRIRQHVQTRQLRNRRRHSFLRLANHTRQTIEEILFRHPDVSCASLYFHFVGYTRDEVIQRCSLLSLIHQRECVSSYRLHAFSICDHRDRNVLRSEQRDTRYKGFRVNRRPVIKCAIRKVRASRLTDSRWHRPRSSGTCWWRSRSHGLRPTTAGTIIAILAR